MDQRIDLLMALVGSGIIVSVFWILRRLYVNAMTAAYVRGCLRAAADIQGLLNDQGIDVKITSKIVNIPSKPRNK